MSRAAQAGRRTTRGEDRQERTVPGTLPVVEVARGVVATSALLTQDDVDALVVPIGPRRDDDEGVQPRSGTADAAVRYGIDLPELTERLKASGAAGEVHVTQLPRAISGAAETFPWAGLPPRLVLVGIGDGTSRELRRAGAAVARATRGLRTVVSTVGADTGADGTTAVVEGYLLGAYRHPAQRSGEPEPGPARRLVLLGRFTATAVESARRAATATWTARVLSATPASTKTPRWFADRATELAGDAGVRVEVLGADELRRQGFGGLLAVGSGSSRPPHLVVVRHEPARRVRSGVPPRHVVLVGKGITYDTGGLSIKPREAMVPMKTDMTGAAVALAAVLGAAAAGVPHRVTALLPLAENAVGASSYRPGDVVTVHGGTTVEVANTDAEGRMVLADALAYADAELDPDVVVDVATLTGAATLGLGRHHGALYSDDDALAGALVAAGAEAGEALWRMPLVEDYASALRSDVADVRHVPHDGWVGAGSITAALFLRRFAGGRRWAHLDIAGPARSGSASHELPEGATGFGARALLRWLEHLG